LGFKGLKKRRGKEAEVNPITALNIIWVISHLVLSLVYHFLTYLIAVLQKILTGKKLSK
jgi:hypothetical protein